MAKNITDLQRLIIEKVSDTAQTIPTGTNVKNTIDDALAEWNQLYADNVLLDVTGNGSNAYNLSSLAARWEIGYSSILEVEYPAGYAPPVYLNFGINEDYYLYRKSNTQDNFVTPDVSPATSETIRLSYSARHVVNTASCTLNDTEYFAFLNLSTSLYCNKMAAKFAGDIPGFVADEVGDSGTKSGEWLTMARTFRKQYEQVMGIGTDIQRGLANATGDIDLTDSNNNDFMFHKRKTR